MVFKKVSIDIDRFPSAIREILLGATIYDSSSSHSNATVYYCDTGFYVKVDSKGALAKEATLGRIFFLRKLGVEIVAYVSEDQDFLVTRSAFGKNLTSHLSEPKDCCKLLAEALQNLHRQVVFDVPISARYTRYMESANGKFSGGYYDESVSMSRFPVLSKKEAWDIMQENKGRLKSDTFIHGDACLPNVMFLHGRFETFIDFNLAGVGDKHIDLYLAIWSLQYYLKTDKYTDYFFDAYGRENFDYEMLRVVSAFEMFG